MTLSKVGAMESAEATQLLTSTLNGYKFSAEEAMNVVDKVSAIDMAAATSSEELMTALSRTANSADNAGISFDKLLAMIGTVSSVTRKSASTIGESFKTIFSRMSNVAAGKDIDDEGESLNDVETSLNKMGIALRSSQNEWRNFEDVIDEVAGKWDSFTSTQQAQIATAIAGTRQQENFRALMSNWEQVEDLVGVATDSMGTATQRMEIYLDSIEAKTKQLKTAWEGFIMSLQQSAGFKQAIEWLTELLEKMESIDWRIIGISASIAGLISLLPKLISGLELVGKAISAIKAGELLATFSGIGKIIAVVAALAVAITGITVAVNEANHSAENMKKQYEESVDSIKKLKEEEEEVSNLINQYKNLSAKENIYGLSSEDKNKLTDISKTLVEQYGLEYDSVNNLTGAYSIGEDAIKSYYDTKKSELAAYAEERDKNFNATIEGELTTLKEYEAELQAQENRKAGGENFNSEYASKVQAKKKEINDFFNSYVDNFYEDPEMVKGADYIKNILSKSYSNLSYDELQNKFTTQNAENIASYVERYGTSIQQMSDELSSAQKLYEQQGATSLKEVQDYYDKVLDQEKIYQNMREQGIISLDEYNTLVEQLEQDVGENFDAKLLNIHAMLGDNSDTFDALANNILKTNSQLKTGQITVEDYINKLNELDDSLDLTATFNGNEEAAANFFSSLGDQIADVMMLISTSYRNGEIDNKTYMSQWEALGNQILSYGEKVQLLFPDIKKNNTTTGADGTFISKQQEDLTQYYRDLKAAESYGNWSDAKRDQGFSGFWDLAKEYISKDVEQEMMTDKQRDYYNRTGDRIFENNNSLQKYLNETYSASDIAEFNKYVENLKLVGDYAAKEYREANAGKGTDEEIEAGAQKAYDTAIDEQLSKPTMSNSFKYDTNQEAVDYFSNLKSQQEQELSDLQKQWNDSAVKMAKAEQEYNDAIEDSSKSWLDVFEAQKKVKESQEEFAEIDDKIVDKQEEIEESQYNIDKATKNMGDSQETVAEQFEDGMSSIQQGIKDIQEYSDSVNSIELIDSGQIKEGTQEYTQALGTISEDLYNIMYDANGNIKQEYENIIAGNADLAQASIGEIQNALANGTISMENASAIMQNKMQGAFTAIRDGAAKLFTALGTSFSSMNISIPVKWTVNGGLLSKLWELIKANQGDTIDLGSIDVGDAGLGDVFNQIGSAIQSVPIDFTIGEFSPFQQKQTSSSPRRTSSGGGGYTPKSSGSGGGGGKSDADKAAEEAAQLAEDIAEFREEEGTALEDITEELINHYRLEKTRLELQKENLDYANDLLDAEENTTQWIKVQNQLLTNQRKQIQELYRTNSKIEQQMEKIQSENPQYNINSWFDEAGNDTLDYINLINSFAQQERDYRATVTLNSQEDIDNAEKHIEELKKQREYVENLHDSVSQLKEAWIDNGNELQDLFSEMNDTLKEMRDTLLDKFMTALEDRVDEVNQAYEDNIDKLDSLITVQERYNDVINSSLDTQAELRKELQSNKDSYQYLDDYMRSIIFNEDDYKELSKELDKVMSDMNALSDEYQYKINNLTEDEMYMLDEITNEYERQVDLKEKEYEILQAQLDVVKARTQLENARNERTVRMFANGEWQWVADPEEIKSANEELADAQAKVEQAIREKEQEELLHQMEAEQDKNQIAIDKNEQLLEQIQDRVDEITTETKSIEEWLELIATEGPPMLHDIFADIGTKLEELMNDLGNDSSLVDAASQNTTEAIKQGLLNGTLDPDQWAEKIGWIKGDNGKWYAPMDDPYYDPAGFDFGKANVDTSSTTDKSGVQIQGQGEVAANNQNQQTSTGFPRQGSLRNVSSVLNIRSGAGMDYGIIGKIPPSGKPQVLGESGNWAQVNYNGITGWASKDYLTYDKGGLLKGKGVALKDTLKPEAILSPEQTKAWTKLVDNLTSPMLAQLTATPSVQKDKTNNTEKYIGDNYVFNNVTVKADDIDQFITSIKGWVPIS